MGFRVGIDVESLHWMLWDRADVRHQVKVNEQELADQFQVSRGRVSHVILAMREAGRIHRPAGSRGPYTVAKPPATSSE